MNEIRPSDYLLVLLHRKKLFLSIVSSIFLLALIFAFNWSVYRASATVEVARPIVAAELTKIAGSTSSDALESLVDLHISRLQQKVFSTGSLIEIITKFNLYTGSRKHTPIAYVAENMRKKINLKLVSSSLANPASAQKASAGQLSAIAFVLTFDYNEPLLAQQVTNELVSRFLDEDLKERRNQAKETTDFLSLQIQSLEATLAEQEKKIAEFRASNNDIRPDALAFNQQAAISANASLQNIESQITTNLGTQGALRSQLALTDPYSKVMEEGKFLTTPSLQLRALKSQYASLSAKYGAKHPDVLKAARQVAALETQNEPANNTAPLKARILDLKARLATAQKTYGPNNPDVISLRNQLMDYEDQLEAAINAGSSQQKEMLTDADNPSYLQIVAQLRATEEQFKALSAQKKSLMAQQEKYRRAVAQNPAAEQQMASLSRDYDNAQLRYRELKAKKMAADMSETIEQDRSGQRLVLIEPPELPLRTTPKRLVFIFGGFVLALAGGLAAVVIAQLLTQSVVGPNHLESLVGVAPLAVIQRIKTSEEKIYFDKHKIKLIGLLFAAGLITLIVFSYVVMPLDVLWAVAAQRLGLF